VQYDGRVDTSIHPPREEYLSSTATKVQRVSELCTFERITRQKALDKTLWRDQAREPTSQLEVHRSDASRCKGPEPRANTIVSFPQQNTKSQNTQPTHNPTNPNISTRRSGASGEQGTRTHRTQCCQLNVCAILTAKRRRDLLRRVNSRNC
jgi:hypothetical protein